MTCRRDIVDTVSHVSVSDSMASGQWVDGGSMLDGQLTASASLAGESMVERCVFLLIIMRELVLAS